MALDSENKAGAQLSVSIPAPLQPQGGNPPSVVSSPGDQEAVAIAAADFAADDGKLFSAVAVAYVVRIIAALCCCA